jgi:hypothetical protein
LLNFEAAGTLECFAARSLPFLYVSSHEKPPADEVHPSDHEPPLREVRGEAE